MKRIFVLPLLLLVMVVSAQDDQELRREFPVGEDFDRINVAVFEDRGLIMYGSDRVGLNVRRWNFLKLDNQFNSLDSVSFDVPRRLAFRHEEYNDHELSMVFVNDRRRVFRLSVLNFETMELSHFNGSLPRRSTLIEAGSAGDYFYMVVVSGRFRRWSLVTVNTVTGGSRIEPIRSDQGRRAFVLGLEGHHKEGLAMLYLRANLPGRNMSTIVRVLKDGEVASTFPLAQSTDNNLVSVRASILGEDHYIFTGAYNEHRANTSTGFFIAEVKEGERTYLEYYNYLSLDNFTDYLPRRQQERINRRVARSEQRGRTLTRNFMMTSHPVVRVDDRNYFLVEFFYPTYYTETYVDSRGVTQTRRVFDGYQYTHASMICFDNEGVKLWDNTFEMWLPHKPFTVRRFISFDVDEEGRVDLFFTSRRFIHSKAFSPDGRVLHDTRRTGFETGREEERVRGSVSALVPWYDGHFLSYGQQRITDTSRRVGSGRTRRVFYLQRMTPGGEE